jgi:uncharacterized membrane-anchored protein YitT (DUF2179 family)
MIAAGIMIGEYPCSESRTCSTLWSSKNLGLLYTTCSFLSVIYILLPLFIFSYRKSFAAASHCASAHILYICVGCWCRLSVPHWQPHGLVEGGNWSVFSKDVQNRCWVQWVFVCIQWQMMCYNTRTSSQGWSGSLSWDASSWQLLMSAGLGLLWRRCATLRYTDILTGAGDIAHGTVNLFPHPIW